MAAEAGLSLPCSQTPKTGVLETRLILYKIFYAGEYKVTIMKVNEDVLE